jgi:hypothetical protein
VRIVVDDQQPAAARGDSMQGRDQILALERLS